jgi:hypothetical protein
MPLSFKKDKTETQRSVSLSTPTYAPTQGHRREATTVRESTPDGTPYVDYQVGDDEAPAPDTRVLSELRGCVGQVNVQTQVEDPSTSGRLRADHRPGSTVSSSSHSTASTASFVYPSTPFGTHSRELQDELGYQSQKAGKPVSCRVRGGSVCCDQIW